MREKKLDQRGTEISKIRLPISIELKYTELPLRLYVVEVDIQDLSMSFLNFSAKQLQQ